MIANNAVAGELRDAAERVRAEIANASSSLRLEATTVAGQLRGDIVGLSQSFVQDADQAREELLARSAELSGQFSSISDTIRSETERARAQLFEAAGTLGEELSNRLGETERQLAARGRLLSQELENRTRDLSAVLSASSGEIRHILDTELTQRLGESERGFADRTRILGDDLDQRMQGFAELLSSRSAEIGRLVEYLDGNTRPLLDRIGQDGSLFASAIETAGRDASERLRTENTAIVATLGRRTEETVEALTRAAEDVLSAFDQRATGTVADVSDLRDRLTGEINGLIGRLSQTSGQVRRLVDDAAGNLSAIDASLQSSGDRFTQAAEQASNQIALSSRMLENNLERLDQLSLGAFSKVASVVDRFAEHGAALGEAVRLIETSEGRLRETLDSGRTGLEELSSGLVARSEEIGGMLRSFEGLMGGLFDKTEERSRSLAARLSSEVGGTLDETDRRLAETEERSRATAADIRMAVETAIQDAASRFEGATDEIRRTAEVIREELSSARAEIRSGVFQLPEETRESTEAMRRAVSDQIRALRDLSEIVQRTGSAIDVAPAPSRTSSAQTASRPAASQPQRPSQPPRREPEPSRAQPRSEPRVEERQTAGPSAASKQEFDEGDFEEQLAASFLTDGNLARDLRGSDTSMSRPQQPAPSREAQRTQPPTADRASAAYGSGVGPSRPVQGPPPAPRSSSAPSTYGSRAPASQPAAPLREPQSAPQRPVMQTAPEETTDRPPEPQGRGWVSDLLRRASQEEEEAARKGAAPAETSAPAPQGQSGSARIAERRDGPRRRSRDGDRSVAALSPRGEQCLHSAALYAPGPADLRHGPSSLSARSGIQVGRRSLRGRFREPDGRDGSPRSECRSDAQPSPDRARQGLYNARPCFRASERVMVESSRVIDQDRPDATTFLKTTTAAMADGRRRPCRTPRSLFVTRRALSVWR